MKCIKILSLFDSVSLDAIPCMSHEPMLKDESSMKENAQTTEEPYKINTLRVSNLKKTNDTKLQFLGHFISTLHINLIFST